MPERDRAAVEGRAYDQGERPRGLDRSATSTAARCFGGVPRDVFKSVRDWKRLNERYRGKPIDEAPGALRVALSYNEPRHKWQVQVILGARRHTLSACHSVPKKTTRSQMAY
jgi:hypothetical protein